jgi:hypothetical protein
VIAVEAEEVVADDDDRQSSLSGFIGSLRVQNFWLRAMTAAVFVALLLIAVWLVVRQKETQPDPIQAGPGTPVNVPSPEPRISPSLHPSPSPVQAEKKRKSPTPERQPPVAPYASLLLPSAVSRGAEAQPLKVPPGAASVPLGLALVGRTNYKTYDVVLEDHAGTKLDDWPNLKAQNFPATQAYPATKGLLIDVPAILLKPDESYRFLVTGVSSKGERSRLEGYSFEAKK